MTTSEGISLDERQLYEVKFQTSKGIEEVAVQATCLGIAIALAVGYVEQGAAFVSGGLG